MAFIAHFYSVMVLLCIFLSLVLSKVYNFLSLVLSKVYNFGFKILDSVFSSSQGYALLVIMHIYIYIYI